MAVLMSDAMTTSALLRGQRLMVKPLAGTAPTDSAFLFGGVPRGRGAATPSRRAGCRNRCGRTSTA